MSADALHPQAAAHLEATAGLPGPAALGVAGTRLAHRGFLDLQRPAPTMAAVEHRFIPGPTADLPVRILRPRLSAEPTPVVVVLHGSGWTSANPDMADEPARVLARDTGLPVVTVNYQKAPEHPFPVPLDDSVATVEWVREHADELGVDPTRVALVGDSSGGNLAAAASALLAAQGRAPAAQALLYPPLDRRAGRGPWPSWREFARGYGLDAVDITWFWDQYVDEALETDPRVSPLLADDFAALPPTFVATAGHDVLRDEGEAYVERLREAGVPVEARRYAGTIHAFWWMDGVLDDARALQLDLARFLRRTLE